MMKRWMIGVGKDFPVSEPASTPSASDEKVSAGTPRDAAGGEDSHVPGVCDGTGPHGPGRRGVCGVGRSPDAGPGFRHGFGKGFGFGWGRCGRGRGFGFGRGAGQGAGQGTGQGTGRWKA